MLNYREEIKDYLQANFTPSDDTLANFKQTTNDLLDFLFDVFPKNCISDYDLNDILLELGYIRYTWVEERIVKIGDAGFEIHKRLVTGWCLKTEWSLRTEKIGGDIKKKPPDI